MTTIAKQSDNKLANSLIGVGFSLNQALVYMANLKLGPASIWDIANASEVKRTTCYVVMNELIVKGYASFTKTSKHSIYSVISPNDLFTNLLDRQEMMRWAVPELNALASHSAVKPLIRMFEGEEGVEQAYQISLSMPSGSEILIYGNPEVYVNYPKMVEKYVRNRVQKNIRVRTIIPDLPIGHTITKDDAKILRQTRILPKDKFDQKTELNILTDKILYLAHSDKKPFATVIESPVLAKEEKSRFELLWNIAKPIQQR